MNALEAGHSPSGELRTAEELQRVHDLLVGIILRDVPFPDVALTMRDLNLMAQVVCWVLRHDHNEQFPQLLERIERSLSERGWALEKPQ